MIPILPRIHTCVHMYTYTCVSIYICIYIYIHTPSHLSIEDSGLGVSSRASRRPSESRLTAECHGYSGELLEQQR